MATSIVGMLATSLLILATTKDCVGELKCSHDQKITTAMTEVSNVLGCFSSIMQDSHLVQIQNNDVLTSLRTLPDSIKHHLKAHEENVIQSLKEELKKLTESLEEYNTTKEWGTLRRDLETVLDRNSPTYKQLQNYKYDDDEPLWHIGKDGNLELVTVLVESGGATVSEKDLRTLLHGAVFGNHLQQVELLLDHGADIEAKGGPYDKSPLVYAATDKNLGALKLLLRRGANMEGTEKSGGTALHAASWSGNQEGVRILVEAGANTAQRNNWDDTALDLAVQREETEIQQYLSQFPH